MISLLFVSCDLVHKFEIKAEKLNRYEATSLTLAKKNRELRSQLDELNFKIKALEAKNNYLTIKLAKKGGRRVAAIAPLKGIKSDMVKFHIYKWSPAQLLAIGKKEFVNKNYDKSTQFYQTFFKQFPKSERITEDVLFEAGVAAYKSGKHFNWALQNLTKLTLEYPTSKYFRGAKLWIGLTHARRKDKKKFFVIVEEFRKKYRNTKEWEILRGHYDEFRQKFKM